MGTNAALCCSDVMKANWDNSKAVKDNLDSMGLAYDPNKVITNKTTKAKMVEKMKESRAGAVDGPVQKALAAEDGSVVRLLEEEVASMPRKSSFRFPPDQVKLITYMMDKHGEDYKAMARDRRNVMQETPKQIKHKILKFRSIPQQFAKYAKEKGLLDEAQPS